MVRKIGERARAKADRELAWVGAIQGKPPAAGTALLDDIFAAMATTGRPFEPDQMAGALVRQLEREARGQGLLS